jgi:hypothetical protein
MQPFQICFYGCAKLRLVARSACSFGARVVEMTDFRQSNDSSMNVK